MIDPVGTLRFAHPSAIHSKSWNGPTKASCSGCAGIGESSAIVELLTRSHGRHLGLVRGGAGHRMRPLLQPGNSVTTVWRARLDEHLGYYVIEGTRLRAATLLATAHATYGVTHLASLVRLLPERDPHEDIYEMLERRSTTLTIPATRRPASSGSNWRCWPNSVSASIWKTAPPPA